MTDEKLGGSNIISNGTFGGLKGDDGTALMENAAAGKKAIAIAKPLKQE